MHDTVYLVVEPMAIIARDLAMNVQDYDPSATVLVAETPDMASLMLSRVPKVRLAFVHVDPNHFATTTLAQTLKDHGTQVVFFGNAAEENDTGILVLHRPFSAETTKAILQRALISRCA